MLDSDTKRRIDTARDILVGKVPDPKSQVEQITIAMIYKFMDDMDAEAEELGGKRSFFAGAYARYGWAKLMRSGLGGHETLSLYAEAITKMPENPGIPALFRDIFKNAYLPYRDPETLRAFLKIIDEFTYDHSEKLGDAFEYLLSVLGSQGDAGQFRSPRHIIDFMVAIIDPRKSETVLDPACGTVGFLISAFKHILRANTDKNGHSTLTPSDKARLAANFKGYDISPDMVRLSLVNLYLHGFTDPHVYEYDTLTSQDRWNEYFDVILANPPFMSPKGGIKPHKRFSIQAKRSEVLFVDYIAEHLTPNGRAAIIVPEGIIFQSQGAYKDLRKMLVDHSLVAVISLPAGCFNPYSGVKTSILILDKALARQSDSIGFFKVENDGYGLGAQRRAVEGEQLTQVKAEIGTFLQAICSGAFRANGPLLSANGATHASPGQRPGSAIPSSDQGLKARPKRSSADGAGLQPLMNFADPGPGALPQAGMERAVGAEFICGLIVPKEQIAANGDYNLSGERYREGVVSGSSWPFVSVGDAFKKGDQTVIPESLDGPVTYLGLENITQNTGGIEGNVVTENPSDIKSLKNVFKPRDILYGKLRPNLNKVWLADRKGICSTDVFVIKAIEGIADPALYAYLFRSARFNDAVMGQLKGAQLPRIGWSSFAELQIPLPPLAVQQEIVAEIEGYQKVINGARAVLDHYRPHIPIHPEWPMVELGDICELYQPKTITGQDLIADGPYVVYGANGVIGRYDKYNHEEAEVLVTCRGATCGTINKSEPKSWVTGNAMVAKPKDERLSKEFLFSLLKGSDLGPTISGSAQPQITRQGLAPFEIPLPPLATQQAIVAEIEAEQALVSANRELIARFEKKIQTTLSRVWGEEEPKALDCGSLLPLSDPQPAAVVNEEPKEEPSDHPLRRIDAPRASRLAPEKRQQAAAVHVAQAAHEEEPSRPTHPDDLDRSDLMALFRDLLNRHGPTERQAVIRLAATELGYQRLIDSVSTSLDKALVTAVRRGVLINNSGALSVFQNNVAGYDMEFLKTQFLAAVSENGRVWMEREDAIRAFSRWLGFRRTGKVIDDTARKLISRLLRGGHLESSGNAIRRV